MFRRATVLPAVAIACALAGALVIAASNATFVITPSSPVFGTGGNNVSPVLLDSAPGYSSGSLASNGVGKTDMYFPPESLFGGREVTVGEVASMSYWTKKTGDHVSATADWYLAVYTKPYAGDASAPTWYGDRIGTEPYFAMSLTETAGDWNQWATDDGLNRLRFFESTQGAPGANFGSYSDPDWDTFKAANGLSGQPRAAQTILFISVQTGSGWASGFTGQVDGLRIELTDGSVANINFEAVNEAKDRAACKKDGWMSLFRADGTGFANQGDCVSYASNGK